MSSRDRRCSTRPCSCPPILQVRLLRCLPNWFSRARRFRRSVRSVLPARTFISLNGRRVFQQQQILDDISHVHGKHTIRAGFSWLHWTITDLDFASIGGPIHGQIITNLNDFFNGAGPTTVLNQAFPTSSRRSASPIPRRAARADDRSRAERLIVHRWGLLPGKLRAIRPAAAISLR